MDFAETGDVSEDDYSKDSIYAVLYSLYRQVRTLFVVVSSLFVACSLYVRSSNLGHDLRRALCSAYH